MKSSLENCALTDPSRAHIVSIKSAGKVVAIQLRFGDGPGLSKYFSLRKLGGLRKAKAAAQLAAREAGAMVGQSKRGVGTGRKMRNNRSGEAGIRWDWLEGTDGHCYLSVISTWTNKQGRPRSSRYSVHRNGLEGALDKAIKARCSAGAPPPNRELLLANLRAEFATRRPLTH